MSKQPVPNYPQHLDEIFDLSNVTSIFEVVGRMEVIIQELDANPNWQNLVPFTKTYFYVTREVASRSTLAKSEFQNFADMEKLDIKFAQLYFTPLRLFLTEGIKLSPWQQYFTAVEQPNPSAFMMVLLGINAHINADLSQALHSAGYSHERDYEYVNQLLEDVIPDMMRFLAWHNHDVIAGTAQLAHKFVIQEFHRIIVNWRTDAWTNYQELRKFKLDSNDFDQAISSLHNQTEELGQDIYELFDLSNISDTLRLIRNLHNVHVRI